MTFIIGDETIENCYFYHGRWNNSGLSVIQIIVDDPNPDDSNYLRLIHRDELDITDGTNKSASYRVKVDTNVPYFVEYDEKGNSHVKMNFFVVE